MAALPPPSATPPLYMTQYLLKRKDGLCPSLLMETPVLEHQVTNAYQTTSLLLKQIPERKQMPRETAEMQAIVEAIRSTLKELVSSKSESLIHNVKFKPKGCDWKMDFRDPDLQNYNVQISLAAKYTHTTNYRITSTLNPIFDKPGVLPSGLKYAKYTFDKIAYSVRKSVVRLEFPEFPEGPNKSKAFRYFYQLNSRIKAGSSATVCRGTHRESGQRVAVKCILRKNLPPAEDAAVYDEVAIMASLDHPNITGIIDFFDEDDVFYIVMELMNGGDLFDRIGKYKSYSEADARDLVVKVLKAMAVCHARGIAHCDMKPKNLLLKRQDVNDSTIKVADFGFAARVHAPKGLTKQCGTPYFVAPEILRKKPYDQQADMWSVGCIVYLLLSGRLPFLSMHQKDLFRKIIAGKYEFHPDDWNGVSDQAKDLVSQLLEINPDNRLDAKGALLHPWLRADAAQLSLRSLDNVSQRLKVFNAKMKLRSAIVVLDTVTMLRRNAAALVSRRKSISEARMQHATPRQKLVMEYSQDTKGNRRQSLIVVGCGAQSLRREQRPEDIENEDSANRDADDLVEVGERFEM